MLGATMPRHTQENHAAGYTGIERPAPTVATSLRLGLTRGDDAVDVATWAGSVPAVTGVAPRIRFGRKWFNLLWLLPLGFVLLLVAVAVAKGLRQMPVMAEFIARYPGATTTDLPDTVGIPVWARWQHFLNLFLMIFILRSGLQILSDHPRLYWTRHCTPGRDWLRVQKPPYLWHNGRYPDSAEYVHLAEGGFADYSLRIIRTGRPPRRPVSRADSEVAGSRADHSALLHSAGRAWPSGAGSPCRPSSTWSNRSPTPSGWCSIPSVRAPTGALRRTAHRGQA
ncbi:MAG: hypothetical protein WCB57_09365 [Pseudonocardiaceae bacterium]